MRLLLDTNVLLRIGNVGPPVDQTLHDQIVAADELYVTPIARAEIAIKTTIGKLELPGSESEFWIGLVARLQAEELPFDSSHAGRMALLPLHHRDPFDRMIAAQCLEEGLQIASTDAIFELYGVRTIR